MKFRRVISVLLTLVLTLLLTACTAQSKKPNEDSVKAKDGIVIFVGTTIFDSSLDPVKGAMSYGYPFINNALLRVNEKSEYVGDLAESWEVTDDALHYTFKLKDSVKFSDGSDMTAEDVAFTYNTIKKNQAQNSSVDLTMLASAEAVDAKTVTFELTKPNSAFLDTTASIGIVPSDSYDSAKFDQYPIGTGAWKVSQYDPNQQIILEANERCFDGVPEIKKVTIVKMDGKAAFASAKSGQLDVVMVDANYADEAVSGMTIERLKTMDIRNISLPVLPEQTMTNAEGKKVTVGNNVTSDLNVRKALSIGIDRKAIIKSALNGVGKPASSFTDNLVWAKPDTTNDNRVEEAKAILESAGWVDSDGDGIREKNGVKCEFDVYSANDNERYQLSVAVAEEAAKLGIKINAKTTTWDEILTLQHSDGVVFGWGQYSPTVLNSLFNSKLFLSGGYDNPVGYNNASVDATIAKAFAAKTHDEAVKAWQDVQQQASVDYPYLYIVNIEHCYFVSDDLDISVGTQIAHPHGHGSPIICNLKDWKLK